jgi:putative ABC transport system permease protein
MFKNYLLITIRNLFRNKIYSFINIAGLAVGMTSFILISLWVQDELSYDGFHENIDNLYRVVDYEKYSNGEEIFFSQNSALLGPILKSKYPEIIDFTRFRRGNSQIVNYKDKSFNQDGIVFADPSIFDLFSFEIVNGNKGTILSDPYSIAITEDIAIKYFGNEDPIGKTLQLDKRFDFNVSAIIKNSPSNSHFQFDIIIPFTTINEFGYQIDTWRNWAYATYVLLDKNADHEIVSEKIKNAIIENAESMSATISLQHLSEIHLKSSHIWGLGGEGDMKYVYIFSAIAIFILLTACFNFMNLATARSSKRAKEVGLRKVIGAERKEIILQFLLESFIISLVALLISGLVVELLLPYFNELSEKELQFTVIGNRHLIIIILSTILCTGLISGLYPALFLSSFQPVKVLKGVFKTGKQGSNFRRVLVTIQFILTISLIFGTLVINRQLNFIRNQKLGFNKDNIVSISLQYNLQSKAELIKNELKQNSELLMISTATATPNRMRASRLFSEWDGRNPDEQFLAYFLYTDDNYVELFDLEMKHGRYFSNNFSTDNSAIVINETAAKAMGMDEPVGKLVDGSEIIGVIKDYHFQSLHEKIIPQMFYHSTEEPKFLLVKLASNNISKSLSSLENSWSAINPGYPLDFQFVDEHQQQMYNADLKVEKIINTFTILALFIACLGLFGLTSFVAEQRKKEIGVRKVLGASIAGILILLNKEFTKWIIIANIIAWPIAYYGMEKWLQSFAYRIEINLWFYLIAGGVVLIISFTTVSIQTIKAAVANPVDSLRNE